MELLKGNEAFTVNGSETGLTIIDFWSFQCSNIMHDIFEVAEFLVVKALGLETPYNKDGWTPYDIDYRNARIEVKTKRLWLEPIQNHQVVGDRNQSTVS